MTANIIPHFETRVIANGFNPFSLSPEEVGNSHGWFLLVEGTPLQSGDGYWSCANELWIDFESRPGIFRGAGETVHTWPWRRKVGVC